MYPGILISTIMSRFFISLVSVSNVKSGFCLSSDKK